MRPLTHRRRTYLTAGLTAALAAGDHELRAQAATNPRFDALVTLTEAKMKEYGVPGVALGIIDGGTTTIRGLGITNVEDSLPVTAHTVFPIASISKTFAATAMMRLVEQGKVDLRAPVRTYLPDFRVRDEAASRTVTPWHLLTHLGGWEGQVSGPDRGTATLENFLTTISDLMQVAPPGKAWSYNNAGFSIGGRVIEVATGTSINRAMRDLVFQPLGLEHAGTTAGDFIVNRFAAGHATRDGKTTLNRPFAPSSSVTAGGVGLCMTDLLAYARFHMGDGTAANGQRVLERKSLEQMRTAQLRKQSTDDDIGLAWHIRQVGPVRTYAHGGTLGGHILLLELVPERNFAVAILTNANTGWRLIQDVEREALKSYLGATYALNQAIAHRGLVETLPSVQPLARQPDLAPYVGTYARPSNSHVVRAEGGKLIVRNRPNDGQPGPDTPVAFFGPDRVVVTDGPDRGQSMEFVRDDSGRVNWIRVVGRVAVRTATRPAAPGVEADTFPSFDRVRLLESTSETSANVSVGDVNGDGRLDIVLVKGRHWPLVDRVLLGDGTGRFDAGYDLGPTSDRSYSGRLADLDGDGDLDVVISNDAPDPKRVYINNGKGRFRIGSTFGRPAWATRNATTADLNQDGLPDVVVANRSEGQGANYICFNRGGGRFDNDCVEFSRESATTITAADFNGDRLIDLAVPHRDGGQSRVYLAGPKGSFSATRTIPFGPPNAAIRMAEAADLDGDALLDIVAIDEREGTDVYFGQRDGTFTSRVQVADRTVTPYALAVGDLNGDGKLDIVVGNVEAPSTVHFNDGSGRRFHAVRFGDGKGTVYGFAIADLDRDGLMDIAAARSDAPNVVYFGRRSNAGGRTPPGDGESGTAGR